MDENFLERKLSERAVLDAVRTLRFNTGAIDFCSNDYLGIVKNKLIEKNNTANLSHGSTGSRLLSGNYPLIEQTEKMISTFHQAEEGLIFNSGYDANLGLLSSVPQKEDVVIYDQLSHASIRDGIRLCFASAFSFLHNNMEDLEKKLLASGSKPGQHIFVVTESVFSMDGDMAPLAEISQLCEKYHASLIVDEAHATGVIGSKGEGLVQHLQLQQKCFARIHTFGKACGCHGAVVLGSLQLKKYLVNFARPLIYSTALPPSAINAVVTAYKLFPFMDTERQHLKNLINSIGNGGLKNIVSSITPILAVIVRGNAAVKRIAAKLQQNNLDVRPILYPTVPKGAERLRIVLHSFNTIEEVNKLSVIICSHLLPVKEEPV
jgi:8-amino-7-oxononanoate synthase